MFDLLSLIVGMCVHVKQCRVHVKKNLQYFKTAKQGHKLYLTASSLSIYKASLTSLARLSASYYLIKRPLWPRPSHAIGPLPVGLLP